MSTNDDIPEIPIDQIIILNPRSRNKRLFSTIVANIDHVGLKRPITITPRPDGKYDLVCGQGRLEAYQALGATTIPAIITNTTKEDRYLMSLAENIARRRHTTTELLKEISTLKTRGYSAEEISEKTDLDRAYVYSITHLLEHGEERLIDAVEHGTLPLYIAVKISTAADHDVQHALREAYETGGLRGQKLISVKRLLAQRAKDGKALTPSVSVPNASTRKPSSAHTRARPQNNARFGHARTVPKNASSSSRARYDNSSPTTTSPHSSKRKSSTACHSGSPTGSTTTRKRRKNDQCRSPKHRSTRACAQSTPTKSCRCAPSPPTCAHPENIGPSPAACRNSAW